jgi:hypothetical protein
LFLLRYYATSRKVAGSIPDKITEFFNRYNPSNNNMDQRSTQPLTEMSTRNLTASKGGRRLKLVTTPLSKIDYLENMGALTSHNSVGLHGLLQE